MDWRALLQNQWFQLCGLVAILALGAAGYDVAAGRFGGHPTPAPNPAPGPGPTSVPTAAPTPVVRLTPKRHGQWIVDAAGASDADSRDLRAVAANAADGDTITIRPGGYEGGFEIARNVRFVGQGNVSIHATNRYTVLVSGQRVAFEHLTIGYEATGDQFGALAVVHNGQVELDACTIGSKGKFDAQAFENATLNARDTRFTTLGTGCALKYANTTHGRLERCEFANNNWGVESVNSAQVDVLGCTFSKNGLPNGNGCAGIAQGGQARLTASFCNFLNDTAALIASESGTLVLNGCTFRDNGVTGEFGNRSDGLILAQTGGKATLANCVLESNRQGLSAINGGNLQLTGTKITGTGIQTDNDALKNYSFGLNANGFGTTVSISSSTIAGSVFSGVAVFGGASLTMVDSTVSNSNESGLLIGSPNYAASHAELTRTRCLGNHMAGLWVHAGCSVNARDCEFSDSGSNGVEVSDPGSQGQFANATCRNNKYAGLWAYDGASLTASGCTLEGNAEGAQAGINGKAQGRAAMELTNCTVRANTAYGIGASQQSSVTIQGGFLGGQRQNVYKEYGATVRQSR